MTRSAIRIWLTTLFLLGGGIATSAQIYPTAVVTISGSQTDEANGTMTIAFNNHSHTVLYGKYSNASSIASAFAAAFSSYPASAWPRLCTIGVCAKANGATITFQLKTETSYGPFALSCTGPCPFQAVVTSTQATPVIVWSPPTAISAGTPLSAVQLNATAVTPATGASVAGTFSYSPSVGTVLPVGSQTLGVTFTPSDTVDFVQARASITLTVNQFTPTISISDIPFGVRNGGSFMVTYSYSGNGSPMESVSSSTLNVCTVSGNLVSFVSAGTCTLQASATATTDYTSATGSAQSFTVNPTSRLALPPPGIINTFASNGIAGYTGDAGGPNGVAVDGNGDVYVIDHYDLDDSLYCRILKVTVSTGDISTVVGSGPAGYSGDGGPATSAEINASAIAVDGAGNIYINAYNHIRMVNALTGIISTIAGNGPISPSGGGTYGPTGDGGTYSGDGGLAISAGINGPVGFAVDGANNLYFVDSYNDRIRKITASTGIISTVAGNGTEGYSGDGGLATTAELNTPTGVAVDSAGNLYIADGIDQRVRMVTASTGMITTVAGNGSTGYSGEGDGSPATSAALNIPTAVAVDTKGNIYIADQFGQRIRKVTASTGIISTIAGDGVQGYTGDGGPATSAELSNPGGIAVDSSDNVFIADSANNVIRAVGAVPPTSNVSMSCAPAAIAYGAQTTCTATVTGSSPTGAVTLTYNGNPWTSCPLSSGSCSVSGLGSVGGGFYTISGSYAGDGNNSSASGSTNVTIYEASVEVGQSMPTISISDIPVSAKIGGSFMITYSYSGDGSTSVTSRTPGVCAVSGNTVSYVGPGRCTLQAVAAATANYGAATGSAQSFIVSNANIALPFPGDIDTVAGTGTGGYSGDGVVATNSELSYPSGTAVDSVGNLYIADCFNNRIRMVTASTGVISTIAGNGTENYTNLYGSDSGDGGPATSAKVSACAVAADSAGNLYLPESNHIRMVNVGTGIISSIAGNWTGDYSASGVYLGEGGYSGDGGAATSAALNNPAAVAVDALGNIYISDSGNARVREVIASTGTIWTVAGVGVPTAGPGNSGDGGPATNATIIAGPIALDTAGNIYIGSGYQVRKVTVSSGVISTVAGSGTQGYSGDGGPATIAQLSSIGGITIDKAGNLYISDSSNDVIRMVSFSTGIISTIAGTGAAGYSGDGGSAINAALSRPIGIAVDNASNLYIGDAGNNVVRLRAAGTVPPAAGVSIACTPNAITHGTPTSCSATLTGSSPTGTVSFTYNGNPWTSCTLSNASCSVSGLGGLGGGLYNIVGTYSGDGNNTAASGSANLTISPGTPTIAVASSESPSNFGQPVTFTASVTNSDTNPVSFYSNGNLLGTATPSNGIATLTTASLPAGSNAITASIADDGNYLYATFSGLTQTVTASGSADTGTVVLQVNGAIVAQTTYGAGSTPASIAQNLASAASSSMVQVSAADDAIYIESLTSGAGSAYPYSLSITDTAGFNTPSFSASPSSGNLQGATSGTTGSAPTLYSYCVSGPTNNCPTPNAGYDGAGNLLGYSDSVMGTWNFEYDSLNRLVSGTPAAGNTTNGGQSLCWSYDSFGNRTAQSVQSGPCPTLPSLPQQTATYNSNNQVTWTSVSAAANGFIYDAAGNVFNDNVNTYLYDGEGRICALLAAPAPGMRTMTGYLYDAEGTRVAKGTITSMSCDPAVNGFQTTSDYVLGPSGEQVTEVGVNANGSLTHQHTNVWAAGKLLATYDNDGLHFYLDDPLGTRRVQTNYAGVIEQQCVSFPFGDGETCTTTPTEHLFTGKERDTESGLDYFGARYYASNMGRWMSPDWADKPEAVPYSSLDNPQSLNLYGYVNNNPLSKADKDGHCPDACVVEGVSAGVIVGVATVAATAAYLATPSGQRSLSTFSSAFSSSVSGSISTVKGWFSSSSTASAPAAPVGASTPSADKASTLAPGPYAGDSIPARGPQRDFTQGERDATNATGAATGCHTCGTTDPGTKSGNFVPDHQPVSSLNPTGEPQRLYPQCLGCSRTQGGEANAAKPNQPPPPQQPKPQGQP